MYSDKKKSGKREESEVACFFVFSHIQMLGYFRLGKVIQGFKSALEGLGIPEKLL